MSIWHLARNFVWNICRDFARIFWAGLLGASLLLRIAAQAPTDEWRRPGVDAMVAEPGQAASLLPNPAGLKTKEERRVPNAAAGAPVLKSEYITEILSIGMFTDLTFLGLISGEKKREEFSEVRLGVLSSLPQVLDGNLENTAAILKFFQNIEPNAYASLVQNTRVLSTRTPATLTLRDIQLEERGGRAREIPNNLARNPILLKALDAAMKKVLLEGLKKTGWKSFSRLFGFSYSNDSGVLAWGLYFGFEQSIAVKMGVANKKVKVPIKFQVNRVKARMDLPIGIKFYLLAPFRFGLATDFGEALPGFTFGLGLKFVPYNGFNHLSFGNYISRNISAAGLDLGEGVLDKLFYGHSGLNVGLDFGVQYHFGAISPKAEFLHVGLKVSDFAGFNIPLKAEGDVLRYALDFDFGVYAQHKFCKNFQLFGGAELLQLRGMIFEPSPFSSLYEPLDHLRVLAGIAVLDNLLRFTLQYYNSSLAFGAQLHAGVFQLGLGASVNPSVPRSWGAELTLRFRSPRDGFNRQRAYRQYQRKR